MKKKNLGRISTPPFRALNRTVFLGAKAGWFLGKEGGE